MKVRDNIKLVGISFFLLVVLAYANHFDNTFHFDDSHSVVDNVHIRTLKNIPNFFHDPTMFSVSTNHRGVRPLVTSSLAIDYWIAGGLHPWAFQLSTFLWHLGLCVMLFFMFKQLLSKAIIHPWVAYIAAIGAGWFAIHTVMAETLNYIIARSDVLSTFFIVASFLMYVAYPERRKFLIYVLLAAMGVFAKETVPMLPIILFFYIILFEEKMALLDLFSKKGVPIIGKTIVKILPLILVVAAVQLYTLSKIDIGSLSYGTPNPRGYYILTQSYVWFHYFRSFFLPYGLSADTDLGVITNIYDDRILIGLLFVASLVYGMFKTSQKAETRPIAFGLIWFCVSLLPTSLMPFAEVMNDHRMYFAFVGLTLSVATTLGLIVIKKQTYFSNPAKIKWLIGSISLLMILHAAGVYARNEVWDSEKSLWKDVTEKSPNNGRGWMNYGNTLMGEGDYTGAIECFKIAEKTNPYYSTLFINFGVAYGAIGKNEEAISSFEKGKKYAPNNYVSYVYYAIYLLKKGEILQAKELIEKAVSLNDTSQKVLDTAMRVYQALGMWEELESIAKRSLELLPNDPKAQAYLKSAQQKEVIEGSANVSDLINLSLNQYNNGEYEAAIATCEKALKIDPKNINAYNNICAAYNMLGEWSKGIEACKKALEIDPDYSRAKANLQWAINENNKK